MKLKLFLLATSAVALASCSSDAVVEDNAADNAIQFSAAAGKASRAADYYCNANLPADFHVWASVNGKQYFADETYAKGEGSTYSITGGVERYWPNEEISFFAAKNYDAFNWNVATASTMTTTPTNTPLKHRITRQLNHSSRSRSNNPVHHRRSQLVVHTRQVGKENHANTVHQLRRTQHAVYVPHCLRHASSANERPNTSERIRKGHILESEGLVGFEDVVEVENDGAGDALPNNGRNRRLVLELDLSRTVREEIREKRHSGAHSA